MNNEQSRQLFLRFTQKHFAAIEERQSGIRIWRMFCEDPWFNNQLSGFAALAATNYNLPTTHIEDIKQESLLRFASSLQSNPLLGFEPNTGANYHGYLSTIIYRQCVKSTRQFLNACESLDDIAQPVVNQWDQVDEQLDFHHLLSVIDEPFRSVLMSTRDGESVAEIAATNRNRTQRTIYRWLKQGVDQLQKLAQTNQPSE